MMLPVIERRGITVHGRRCGATGLALAAMLVLAACGGADTTEASSPRRPWPRPPPPRRRHHHRGPDDHPGPTTTTQAPTTTSTLPAIGSTTVFETSTTLGVQETEPIAPPLDAYASEPVIEMGTISIPKIGVSSTMYEGIRMTTLDYGPGHWPGTALPGQAGNVVVGGHRTSKHQVFRDVDQLVAGDEIVFEDDRGRHVYRVSRVEIVEPTAVWIVNPTETPTATLFACHPPGSTRQRIVVFADLVTT
jgi:sortase A